MSLGDLLQSKFSAHEPDQIGELVLDDLIKTDKLNEDQKTTLEKYVQLVKLSMNNIGLKTLDNCPKLDELQLLELNKNELNGDDLKILVSQFPSLLRLKLEDNKIDSLDKLLVLKDSSVQMINIKGNPICEKNKDYVKELFTLLPQLGYIDYIDKDGHEIDPAEIDDIDDEEFLEQDDEEFGEEGDEEGEFEEVEDEEGELEEVEDDGEEEEENEEGNKKKAKK